MQLHDPRKSTSRESWGSSRTCVPRHAETVLPCSVLPFRQDPIQGEHFRQEGLRLYQALKQRASSSPDDAPAESEKGRAPSVERGSGSRLTRLITPLTSFRLKSYRP